MGDETSDKSPKRDAKNTRFECLFEGPDVIRGVVHAAIGNVQRIGERLRPEQNKRAA
jgi:hypothetical protein